MPAGRPDASTVANNRERILAFIVAHPGTWISEIAREVDLAHTAVARTLAAFVEAQHVFEVERDRQKHYFARFTPWEMDVLIQLDSNSVRGFLSHVAARPAQDSRQDITQALTVTTQAMSNMVNGLITLGLIEKTPLATGGAGVGYRLLWGAVGPQLRLLRCKLPSNADSAAGIDTALAHHP